MALSIGANRERIPTVFKPLDLAAATAETTIWTPASGERFRLMGFVLTAGAATTLIFKDGTGLATVFTVRLEANVPLLLDIGNGIFSGAADRVLSVTRGTSSTLVGTIWGTEE